MPETDKQRLASSLLCEPVGDWILRGHRAGCSYRTIADALAEVTGGKVRVTRQAIGLWRQAADKERTMPDVVVSDDAVLVAVQAIEETPELEFEDLGDAERGDTRAELTAAAPHLIQDWVTAVLAQYPHITPRQLREAAAGLLPEETP